MSHIQIKNINKKYKNKTVLNHMNLDVDSGELMVLLGKSGSGKTTLLHIIAGIVELDLGEIHIQNQCINNLPPEKRETILLNQDLLLFPHMDVFTNIAFGLKMRRLPQNVIEEKVLRIAKSFGIENELSKFPESLSGGQKQRVAIARAVVLEPRVLLLDEPFSKLDHNLRVTMEQFVCKIQREFKITTIMVTHDQEEAMTMADKIAILDSGHIIQVDHPKTIYENPNSYQVSEYFIYRNYFKVTIKNNIVSSVFGEYKINQKDGKYLVMLRPEQINSGSENTYQFELTEVAYQGGRYLCTAFNQDVHVYFYGDTKCEYKVGQIINLRIDLKSGLLLPDQETDI